MMWIRILVSGTALCTKAVWLWPSFLLRKRRAKKAFLDQLVVSGIPASHAATLAAHYEGMIPHRVRDYLPRSRSSHN